VKIRSDLAIFSIADPVYLFQIISAAKRTCSNNSSCHHRSNTGNHFQFFLCGGVNVDLAQRSLFFCMRLLTIACAATPGRGARGRRGRERGRWTRQRRGAWRSLCSGDEIAKGRRLLRADIQSPGINAPSSDFLLSRFVLELLKLFLVPVANFLIQVGRPCNHSSARVRCELTARPDRLL
jgi:hypothetical protein